MKREWNRCHGRDSMIAGVIITGFAHYKCFKPNLTYSTMQTFKKIHETNHISTKALPVSAKCVHKLHLITRRCVICLINFLYLINSSV